MQCLALSAEDVCRLTEYSEEAMLQGKRLYVAKGTPSA